jgi:hypothetical protein
LRAPADACISATESLFARDSNRLLQQNLPGADMRQYRQHLWIDVGQQSPATFGQSPSNWTGWASPNSMLSSPASTISS